MNAPKVSVVMGVRDGEAALAGTIDSVLSQEGVELELVVVDDGSTDAGGAIVRGMADRDARVRLLEQPATGLTAALIRGCQAARGEYIARQDCGDRSLPGRLATLAALLDREPDVVLVSGGTRFLAPGGELLYEISQTPEESSAGLAARQPENLRGPSIHGCVMFRRSSYEASGGYRPQFVVAQDLDLWLRLTENGGVSAVPEILYEATFSLGSISALQRERQVAAAQVALAAAQRRRRGESDTAELERAIASAQGVVSPSHARARAAYFIGSCLARRDRRAARAYFRAATLSDPFHLKAWLRWLTAGR